MRKGSSPSGIPHFRYSSLFKVEKQNKQQQTKSKQSKNLTLTAQEKMVFLCAVYEIFVQTVPCIYATGLSLPSAGKM